MNEERMNAPHFLVLSFLIIILTGSILLATPWAARSGHTQYIDALFVSTSAVCVTGLVPVDTATHWSMFGQMVILLLIQIGGLGVMSFAAFFALLLGRKINLRERLMMQQAINVSAVGGIVRIVRYLLISTFAIEALGALILAFRWAPDMGLKKAVWFGIFHSISAFNNAGFDLFGNFKSLTDYTGDVTVSLVFSILIILGGLGFFVLWSTITYHNIFPTLGWVKHHRF
jgi:trk system potassium uptake protein TrkH